MPDNNSAFLAREIARGMRPDAHHFIRPDWRKFVRPGYEREFPFDIYERYERKYRPDQPRVPAGNPDGGEWTTDGGGGGRPTRSGRAGGDKRTSESGGGAPPVRLAQYRRRRGGGSIVINGRLVEMSPAQAARLAVVQAQARDAIRRVRELDPNWKPVPEIHETVEGTIGAYQAEAQQAQQRIEELRRVGIGPGPYAGDSIPARGPERNFTTSERREVNRIGAKTGCHTCGVNNPGGPSGNFVLDHQPPTAWNPLGRSQRLYPQCPSCSSRQGNWIYRNGGRR